MKIKDLKKDVNSIYKFVIEECYTSIYYSPATNYEYVFCILSDAIEQKEELLKLINLNRTQPKNTKQEYLLKVTSSLFEFSAELIDRLNQQN